MSSKKSRDSSKSKHSSKDEHREEKHRRSSKDYRSTYDDHEVQSSNHRDKSKSKHSSSRKSAAHLNDDAQALAEEEEERRRQKKQQRKQQDEEEERLKREQEEIEEERRRRKKQQRKQEEEEEERLRREQEEYEEHQRRKKDRNRDIENGDGRKKKSSRDQSPPPTTKNKTKVVEKDDNYSDDFEQNYDDDFDDEPPPPPAKRPTSSYKEEKSRSTYNSSPPPTKSGSSIPDRDTNQVFTSSRRFHSHDLSDRIRRRYKDLSRLIVLDRQTFHILDMAPMPAHAAYMRDISLHANKKSNETDDGTNWTSNIKTQTNDDAEHVQSQTEEIDTRTMWTQHPSESQYKACGSGNTNIQTEYSDESKIHENEDLLRMLRLETDLGRYQTFVINAGKLIFALLDEQHETTNLKSKSKRSKENDEQEGMQQKSNLDFSSGLTILRGLSIQSDAMVAAVCFCQDKPEQIAVFYQPIFTTSYGAIYSIRDPDKPLRTFTCEASIRCCSSSTVYIFAGCHDGSVVLFDTSEPNKYKSDSKESIPSSPTFSTANIQFNERHYNEVIRVVPLRMSSETNKTGAFSLASLDKDGLIIIWSVVELIQSDEAGSIADLGLKPGGRVRMTQTSSIQIKQSIHMARNSIQAYDLSYPVNDIDHLYVASNANAVYHMTRYGEMGSPAKLRMSSDLESQIEVTCLSFNPVINKLLLVGTGHGQINLYFTGRDEPILNLPQAFRSSSTVLSCTWSAGRASVFFAHDSQGYIKYWDLTKDLYQPIGSLQIENLSHFVLSISNQYETAFALVIKHQSSKIEVHQLKRAFATHSDAFTDNFKTLLKEMMSNA